MTLRVCFLFCFLFGGGGICLLISKSGDYWVFILFCLKHSLPWFRVSGREWCLDHLLAPVVLSPWEPWLSRACLWVLVSARLPISNSIHLAPFNWEKKKKSSISEQFFFPPSPFITAWFESFKNRILLSFLFLFCYYSRYYRNRSSSLPCAIQSKFDSRKEKADEGKHSTVSKGDS